MIKRKNNAEIALRVLLAGQGVKLFPEVDELFMGEDYSIGVLAHKMDKDHKPIDGSECIFPVDLPFKDFVVKCQELSDETIAHIVSNLTLSEVKGELRI